MASPRLYLYRKAGRTVWDAEMWLSDGGRRVWRTGIEDRTTAESAARARLEALNLPAQPAIEGIARASAQASSDAQIPVIARAEAFARARVEGMPSGSKEGMRTTPASTNDQPRAHGWSDRLDRWFFGDLASLWHS